MDVACLACVRVLARRAADALSGGDEPRSRAFANVAALGYALYLPAISFSQFATSEIPALLLILIALVLLTSRAPDGWRFATAGLCVGLLGVTRPSLLPLLFFLPAALLWQQRSRPMLRHAALFVIAGVSVISAVIARNAVVADQPTIAQNSAYNLYIGNRELYAEDLDLFHPVATPGQIEFRRQFFAGELTYPSKPPEELQREALAWIAAHPGTFARRALGRLARVFAPKTDVLELLGGERTAGIFSRSAVVLIAFANLQWALVLFPGLAGLAVLWRSGRNVGILFLATVLGSLPLCLIAIAKPRYAFPFEPLLLIAALLLLKDPTRWTTLGRRDRWVVGACVAFILWGWAAWLTFAITSRVALASTA
jgi:hypothetical protein